MKKISFVCMIVFSLANSFTAKAQVGINTTTPHPSAVLDIVSEDKGMLIPRLTLSQRGSISTPANGLLIYQTDDVPGFYFFNGTAWQQMAGASTGASSKKRSILLDGTTLSATMRDPSGRLVIFVQQGNPQPFQTQIPLPADWNGTTSITVNVFYSSYFIGGSFSTRLAYVTTGFNASLLPMSNFVDRIANESSTLPNSLQEVSYTITPAPTDKLLFFTVSRPGADNSPSPMYIHSIRIEYFD